MGGLMFWIGLFIGGFAGMLIMALLQIGKISDLYEEVKYWQDSYTKIYKKWENLKNAKATSEKPK